MIGRLAAAMLVVASAACSAGAPASADLDNTRSPSPSAAAPSASPKPTAAASSVVSATPTPPGFDIGPGVTAEDAQLVRDGVFASRAYFGDAGPLVVHVRATEAEALAVFAQFRGWTNAQIPQWARDQWAQCLASSTLGAIFVRTNCNGWSDRSATDRRATAAHEYFHAVSAYLAGSPIDQPNDAISNHGPTWLNEGTAEYGATRALAASGLADYATARARWLPSATRALSLRCAATRP